MTITKEFLDAEIVHAETRAKQLANLTIEVNTALSVMRQMRDYLDKPEPEATENESNAIRTV